MKISATLTFHVENNVLACEEWKIDKEVLIQRLIQRLNSTGINSISFQEAIQPEHVVELLNIMIDARNFQSLGAILQHMKEKEIDTIQRDLFKARDYLVKQGLYTNSTKFLKEFTGFFKGDYPMKHCYAGYLLCNVDSYGNVTQCSLDPRSAGNIRKNSFRELWNSKEFDYIRKDHNKEMCGHCWLSCFAEPSFRMSFFYSMRNLLQVLTEISFMR